MIGPKVAKPTRIEELARRDEKMRELYQSGLSTTEVGAAIGLDASGVSRKLRAMGVQMRPFGGSREDHWAWAGETVSYSGAHMRVRAHRGSAREHTCRCGSPAKQWAYDHTDPDEKSSPMGAFSADPDHYIPLCVPCHKRFDLDRIRRERS